MRVFVFFFFFNDTATTEIYTLSLHDALPISRAPDAPRQALVGGLEHGIARRLEDGLVDRLRSEEHTSELQSLTNLVCRLLLEKKKKTKLVHLLLWLNVVPELLATHAGR